MRTIGLFFFIYHYETQTWMRVPLCGDRNIYSIYVVQTQLKEANNKFGN